MLKLSSLPTSRAREILTTVFTRIYVCLCITEYQISAEHADELSSSLECNRRENGFFPSNIL